MDWAFRWMRDIRGPVEIRVHHPPARSSVAKGSLPTLISIAKRIHGSMQVSIDYNIILS
jgi:hypothetical protein